MNYLDISIKCNNYLYKMVQLIDIIVRETHKDTGIAGLYLPGNLLCFYKKQGSNISYTEHNTKINIEGHQ